MRPRNAIGEGTHFAGTTDKLHLELPAQASTTRNGGGGQLTAEPKGPPWEPGQHQRRSKAKGSCIEFYEITGWGSMFLPVTPIKRNLKAHSAS